MMQANNPKILPIKEWETPATKYPRISVGKAKITECKYEKGFYYLMEKVRGYDYFAPLKDIKITCLEINNEVVMVDDPLHYYGMQDLAKACHGNVLVAGLGLGLVAECLTKNPSVKNIDVVEIEKDVIELNKSVSDLQILSFVNVHNTDILSFIKEYKKPVDSVILDIWWGEGNNAMKNSMFLLRDVAEYYLKCKDIFIWGLRHPKLNPACTEV